jgi:tetratricopeptide (TPR) repeat protein
MRPIIIVFAATLFVASISTPAHADKAAAREAFKKGRNHFKAGEFADAARWLTKAYRLAPHPALLRYLGQTYVKMGLTKKALAAFRKYVQDAPQAPDAKDIRVRIVELEKQQAEEKKKAAATPAATPAVAPPAKPATAAKPVAAKPVAAKPAPSTAKVDLRPTGEDDEVPDVIAADQKRKAAAAAAAAAAAQSGPSALGIMKWTSTGLAVGGIAMGIVFGVLANGKASDLESAAKEGNPNLLSPTVTYQKKHYYLQQDYKRFNTMSLASYITGGVFAATAVTLFIIDGTRTMAERRRRAQKGKSVALTPVIGPGMYGVSSRIDF